MSHFLLKNSCKHAWCPKRTVVSVLLFTVQLFQTLFNKNIALETLLLFVCIEFKVMKCGDRW